jgi:hypothetical protein
VSKKIKLEGQSFIQWECGIVFGIFKVCGLKITTDTYLEPILTIRRTVPPIAHAYSWRGAKLNKGSCYIMLFVYIKFYYTGRFIIFSVITNIYEKKTKVPTLVKLFTVTGKLKKLFFQTEMSYVSPMVHVSNNSSCQKNFFNFPVAVKNSTKMGPLVFLL